MLRSPIFRLFLLFTLASGGCSSGDTGPGTGGDGGAQGFGGSTGGMSSGAPGGSRGGAIGTGGASSSAGTGGASGATGGAGGGSDAAVGATGGAAGTRSDRDAQGTGPASDGSVDGDAVGPRADASGAADPGSVGDGDFIVGPTYTPSPDLRLKAGAPPGFTVKFSLTSAMSNIYKGDDFTPPQPFTRTIQVFVPEQYVNGDEAPFMVSSDGFYAGLQTVVQNLADDPSPDHRVPPLVIIGIQNGPDTPGMSERSLEYDTVSDRYWQFVTKEVLPAAVENVRARFSNFKLTSDPDGRGGYGCSSGGPAVMGLAWFGDFNRVLSFSGSYTALHPTADHPAGAWEYPQMIADAPLRPSLRVFLEVGQNDNGSTATEAGHRNWVIANRDMAAALKAKGNHYRFIFAQGAGHCDNNPRNQVMPEGLIWLWRGWQPK